MIFNLPPFVFPNRQFPGHERILIPGLPFFPSEIGGAGEKIKIIRFWQIELTNNYTRQPIKRVFIRLEPPEYKSYEKYSPNISFNVIQHLYQCRPDLEIVWMGEVTGNIYLILEQTPSDLDDDIFTQYIVRFNNPQFVNIVGQIELKKILPNLKNQVDYKPTVLVKEIENYLGAICEINSYEYYSQCIKERSITKILKVRWDIVPADKMLSIRKWQRPLLENLSISVPIPSDPTMNEDFFVKEYLNVDDQHYLILQAERTLISGEKLETYLVKLLGINIGNINNDSEFQQIAHLFIQHLERPSSGNNFRPLGSITVKETEFIANYLSCSEKSIFNSSKTSLTNNVTSPEKTSLTNLLLVRFFDENDSNNTFKVPEQGQKLIISKLYRVSRELCINLVFPEQINFVPSTISKTFDLSTLFVECIFPFDSWYYIVLLLPSHLSDEMTKPRFILKIQDFSTLITLTEEELTTVKPVYQNNKNSSIKNLTDLLSLLNSLSNNNSFQPLDDIIKINSATAKQNNKITQSHLGKIYNYSLEKKVHQNASIITYLAKQTNLGDRQNILSIIPEGANDIDIGRFIKKWIILSKLEHPNIIKLYQIGKSDGYYFASLQYVKGQSLFSHLDQKKVIAPLQLLFLIKQVVDALSYAHENNILHGNLKPTKILITPQKQVFLLGFINQSPIANTVYLAPEQISNNKIYAQTDVYSLAFITFEALTGHQPFESNLYEEILAKKFSTSIPPIQTFNKLLPKTLDDVFQKALAVEPKMRYQTVKEFFLALKDGVGNLASQAQPISEFAIVESDNDTNKNYLGLSATTYYLEHLLGNGIFSWVYYGVDSINLTERAFKIAKPPELVTLSDHKYNATQSIEILTGCLSIESPNIYQLLQFQAEKMQKIDDPALVKIDKIIHTNNICYYQMEYICGQTLRDLIGKEPIPIRVIIEIVLALDRLSQNPNFRYHGDLKPENIIITETDIKLIDLGYFGCEEKGFSSTIITTPSYYPDLLADDLFALGLILWEIICQQQPLTIPASSSEFVDLSKIGENLFDWVDQSERVGQYLKSPILHIKRPSELRPDISPILEDFLLKALGLYIREDNKIDRKLFFKTFSQFAKALESLIETGITHL